ncbi:MAG TPA: alpha/beta hydrolase domain-containing protein [Vicinamibacteria bacterium]|nr:alpha/beta hydrolase domain-containing protein [Vicinamibacteria bacterium]
MSWLLALALYSTTDTIEIPVDDLRYEKRYVLRVPDEWNRKLVIGAHGGSGGEAHSRDGRVMGTDETALDDVVGVYAVSRGFAYASLDRDGIGGTPEGLALTKAFTDLMRERLGNVIRTYLVGLSMGGGIARLAAEEAEPAFDGVVIIAGAHGDARSGDERRARMAELWPLDEDEASAYAELVATPPEARRFWPFLGQSSVGRAGSGGPGRETSGLIRVPVIEVVGTFDDFVRAEVLAYKRKVLARGQGARHRLYQIEGAWHISSDDDAISSFQYAGSRMGLSSEEIDAMATGTTYIPTVQEALELLDRWVDDGTVPPEDATIRERQRLTP